MAEYALDVWDRSVWVALWVRWNRGVDSEIVFIRSRVEEKGELQNAGKL